MIDQSVFIIFHPLTWFFILPFVLLYISYKLHKKFDPNDVNMYATLMILGLLLTMYTHYGGHKYSGNSYGGYEWLGAFIVAAIGNIIALLTLAIDSIKYYLHKKHKSG